MDSTNVLLRQNSQGKYVRVIGTMKSFNNKRSVNATICKVVTDFNEPQYHLLEVMYVHLYHTRGPPVSVSSRRASKLS